MLIQDLINKIKKKLTDDEGLFRQGQFTPINAVQKKITDWSSQPRLQSFFHPIEAIKQKLQNVAQQNPQSPIIKWATTTPSEEIPFMGKTFTMPKIPIVSSYVKYVGAPQAEAIGKGIQSYAKTVSPRFFGKPTMEDIGNIAGAVGAINPVKSVVGGLLGTGFKAVENIAAKKPINQDLYSGYRSGFEFQSKLGPIAEVTGGFLKPVFSRLNPAGQQSLTAYIKLAKNPLISQETKNKLWSKVLETGGKQLGEAFTKGFVGMGAYGATLPAKNLNERIKNFIDQGIQGGVFEAGIKGLGQAGQIGKGIIPIEGEQKDVKKLVARAIKEGKITKEESQAVLGILKEKPTVKIKLKTTPLLSPTENISGGGVVGEQEKILKTESERIFKIVKEKVQPELDLIGKKIAQKYNAEWVGTPKSVKSLLEKVKRKQIETPGYNLLTPKDHARGGIIVNDVKDIPNIIKDLKNQGFNVESTIENPLNHFGYRGINSSRKMSFNLSGEIQVHTPTSWKLKVEISDPLYRKWRNVEVEKLSQEEIARMKLDNKKVSELWRNYWLTIPSDIRELISSSSKGIELKRSSPVILGKGTQPFSIKTKGSLPLSIGRVSTNLPSSSLTKSVSAISEDIITNNIKSQELPPLSDEDLIARLTKAIKEAKPLRETQEALYEKARGEKLAKLLKIREKMAGEKGFYEELGALKGELPKVQFETIRQEFNQEKVDRLFNMIKENKSLDAWEKVNAQVGLQKILGEKGLGVPTKSELEKLYKVYGKEFTETLLSKRPFFEKLQEAGMQLYNLPRSLMAGVGDLSATFMQNVLFAYRHPITTAKNFIEQVKMFASEPYYKQSMEEIANRPTYELMKKAKVNLTEVSPVMSAREEQFMSSWTEKIPGLGRLVRSTGRAWTGFLNKMRADVFDQIVNSANEVGKDIDDPLFLKSLGEFVNAGTGRGSLGQLERVAPILSQGLFSARKLAALGQTLNPVWYIKADPLVRKEALKTMLAFLGGGTTILGLAKLAGAEVGDDPTSTDFGKIKIGNTRFNIFGTYQQVAVLFARLFKGYATSSTTGKRMILGDETAWRPLNRFDLITRFFESKEHPTLSLIIGALRGQTNLGQPFEPASEILRRFIPMVLADSYDLYKEHGAKGLLGVVPLILGIPTQTYGREYAVQETTPTGKPKIRLKPETDLAEDIILKLTGKPKTNIPDQQYIVPQLQKERQGKIEYEQLKRDLMEGKIPTGEISQDFKIQKLLFEYSPEKQKIIGDILLYKDENDKVKEIGLDFKIEPPKLTNNTELDKKILSKYKSEITKKTNDIVELYKRGFLSSKEAEALLLGLKNQTDTINNKIGKGKKIKITPVPKAKRVIFRIKNTPIKSVKIKVRKTTKIPLSKRRRRLKIKVLKVK